MQVETVSLFACRNSVGEDGGYRGVIARSVIPISAMSQTRPKADHFRSTPTADITHRDHYFRKVPTTDSCTATSNVVIRSPDRHGQESTEGSRCLAPWQSLR
jgi:hypothetical protein